MINVYYVAMSQMNNHMILPPFLDKDEWDLPDDVAIHQAEVTVSAEGDHVSTNCHILVDTNICSTSSFLAAAVPVHHRFIRECKLTQAIVALRLKGKDYRPIRTFSYITEHAWLTGVPAGNRVLLKTKNGARGIGQLIVTRKPNATWQQAMRIAMECIDNGATKTFDGKKNTYEDDYCIIHHVSGMENEQGESLNTLKHVSDVIIQDVEETIVEEYRLLLDMYGKVVYSHQRMREERNGDYKQGTYSYRPDGSIVPMSEELLEKIQPVLYNMNTSGRMSMGSVDVFVRADGTWGFFEWQPQTGLTSMDYDVAMKIHVGFIRNLCQQYVAYKAI